MLVSPYLIVNQSAFSGVKMHIWATASARATGYSKDCSYILGKANAKSYSSTLECKMNYLPIMNYLKCTNGKFKK